MEAMRCVAMKKQFPIISFEHASFQYEGQSQESLKDVKLIIKSGEFLVITERMWKDHINQVYQ